MENNEILELIKLDLQIKESLNKKHEEKDTLKQQIADEKILISKQAWDNVDLKIAQTKEELDQQIIIDDKENKENLAYHIHKLEEVFESNRTIWVDEIVNRCLE